MVEVVNSRLEAAIVALLGVSEHPEQVDVGPWRWSARPTAALACWRHVVDWDRTVTVRPVSPVAVGIEYPDGTMSDAYPRAEDAIAGAVDWMETHD